MGKLKIINGYKSWELIGINRKCLIFVGHIRLQTESFFNS